MNTQLEAGGKPATFCRKTGLVAEALEQGTNLITLCAWHDGSVELRNQLNLAGYRISDGICRDCSVNFLNPKQ